MASRSGTVTVDCAPGTGSCTTCRPVPAPAPPEPGSPEVAMTVIVRERADSNQPLQPWAVQDPRRADGGRRRGDGAIPVGCARAPNRSAGAAAGPSRRCHEVWADVPCDLPACHCVALSPSSSFHLRSAHCGFSRKRARMRSIRATEGQPADSAATASVLTKKQPFSPSGAAPAPVPHDLHACRRALTPPANVSSKRPAESPGG